MQAMQRLKTERKKEPTGRREWLYRVAEGQRDIYEGGHRKFIVLRRAIRWDTGVTRTNPALTAPHFAGCKSGPLHQEFSLLPHGSDGIMALLRRTAFSHY